MSLPQLVSPINPPLSSGSSFRRASDMQLDQSTNDGQPGLVAVTAATSLAPSAVTTTASFHLISGALLCTARLARVFWRQALFVRESNSELLFDARSGLESGFWARKAARRLGGWMVDVATAGLTSIWTGLGEISRGQLLGSDRSAGLRKAAGSAYPSELVSSSLNNCMSNFKLDTRIGACDLIWLGQRLAYLQNLFERQLTLRDGLLRSLPGMAAASNLPSNSLSSSSHQFGLLSGRRPSPVGETNTARLMGNLGPSWRQGLGARDPLTGRLHFSSTPAPGTPVTFYPPDTAVLLHRLAEDGVSLMKACCEVVGLWSILGDYDIPAIASRLSPVDCDLLCSVPVEAFVVTYQNSASCFGGSSSGEGAASPSVGAPVTPSGPASSGSGLGNVGAVGSAVSGCTGTVGGGNIEVGLLGLTGESSGPVVGASGACTGSSSAGSRAASGRFSSGWTDLLTCLIAALLEHALVDLDTTSMAPSLPGDESEMAGKNGVVLAIDELVDRLRRTCPALFAHEDALCTKADECLVQVRMIFIVEIIY
ncbi:unnamed protein product [Protopolystoma xenopodis]|uniref:Uncharacterized protein n=1 Tax=Protopolystoma xenopodis TaxID=117903 RepID=A0A3S5B4X7_9PLAT|nr:unnamed protein product [Protopolystoma xenopodis]